MNRTLALIAVLAAAVLLWLFTQAPESTPTPTSPPAEQGENPEQPEDSPEPASDLVAEEGVERQEATPLAEENVAEVAKNELPSLRVQVVSLEGEPLPGVPVVLLRKEIWGLQPTEEGLSDEQGYVTLHDQTRYGPSANEVVTMMVGFPFPVKGASKPIEFASDHWPQEDLQLKLPETGSVAVHLLDLDGTPWLHSVEVHIAPVTLFAKKGKPIREKGMANIGQTITNGVAEFPHVGLGYRFEVGVPWDPWAKWEITRIAGPTKAGEAIRVELRAQSTTPVWSLDLVDQHGEALHDRTVLAQWHTWHESEDNRYERQSYIGNFESSENGHLEMPRPTGIDGDLARLILTAGENEHGPIAYGQVDIPLAQVEGAIEFGTQILRLSEPLASGKVLAPDGTPLKASISIRENVVSPLGGGAEPSLEYVPGARTIQETPGVFEKWGVSQAPTLELEVSANGFLPQTLTVDRGATGLEFILAPDLGVAGKLTIPEGFAAKEFRVAFRAGIEPPEETSWWNREFEDTPAEDGSFRVNELRDAAPGYLAVFHQGSRLKVAEFANVVPVSVDGPQDPRLAPIALATLYRFHAQATGPGDDSPMLQWSRVDKEVPLNDSFNFSFSGKVEFVSTDDTATVALLADGFRYQETVIPAGESQIELERAPVVQFQAPDLPTLPNGFRYSIELDAVDGPDLLDLTTSLPEGIGGGVYPAPMPASGKFNVRLRVRNTKTGEVVEVRDGEKPWEFGFEIAEEAAGQLVNVPIPVQGIEEALAQAQGGED